jgi:hypothetical protein
MNIGSSLLTHLKAPELVQPAQAAFHHPAPHSQATAMRLAAPSQLRPNTPSPQFLAQGLSVLAPLSRHRQGTPSGPTPLTPHWWDALYQGQGLSYLVDLGPSKFPCQGDALGLGAEVMFTACLGPVRGMGTPLWPPKTARTEARSHTLRSQSMRSAPWSRRRPVWFICSHRPALWKSLRLRQQVIPLPQPVFWGRASQGIGVLRTQRMAVRAWRRDIRGRPPLGLGGAGGREGWSRSHSSSDTEDLPPQAVAPF